MSPSTIESMVVEVEGSGEAVICIHGLGGTSNTFQPIMSAFVGRRVIRPDLPCSGRSPLVERPSVPEMTAAIARLAKRLEIARAVVVGHSLGSLIAQHLAAEYGTLVSRLVCLGALIEPSDAARQALRGRAAAIRRDGIAPIADQVMTNGTSPETRARNPAAAAFVRESVMRQSPEGYARLCEALADAYAANHARIACPTLVMTGEDDQTAPPAVARLLAEKIPGAVVRILPRCGHWPSIEKPEEVGREVRAMV